MARAAGRRRLPGLRQPVGPGGAAPVPAAAGHAEVLVDGDSPYHAAPLALALAGIAGVLPRLLEAYRAGEGVAYAEYGRELRDGIAAANRPMFLHELGERLAAGGARPPPAAPLGTTSAGAGPGLRPGGVIGGAGACLPASHGPRDPPGRGVGCRRRDAAAAAGVADRVSFEAGDAAHLNQEMPFDLVTMFEALHDMGDPVGALGAARGLLADDGSVLVADERVADAFTTPGDPTERLMYGWSILHCLPATLAEDPVEATGTVLRAPTLAGWAAAAGFAEVDVVAIDNPFWRFYRLRG